jgi:RNA polymerase sigma factor (sigma-70 family)
MRSAGYERWDTRPASGLVLRHGPSQRAGAFALRVRSWNAGRETQRVPNPEERMEELARPAAAGDQAALAELLTVIEPLVLRACGRFLTCRQDAEEACQDTLVAVARHIGRFEGRSSFRTWLYRVAANQSRSTYRSLKRRAVVSPGDLPEPPDPRTTSVIAGSRLDLLEALGRMSTRHAQVVALRDVLDLEYVEIAEVLDTNTGTVKSRLHEARQRLQYLLDVR